MKTVFLLVCSVVATLTASASDPVITVREITADYVRDHPTEFYVNAKKGQGDLIDFTVDHRADTRMFYVASISVVHRGKLVSVSTTPFVGRKGSNGLWFSFAADDVAQCEFSLRESALDDSGEQPKLDTIIYQFRLVDFVPKASSKN